MLPLSVHRQSANGNSTQASRPQRAGEMGDRCVDCNGDIRERDDCGGIGHIGQSVADLGDVVPRKQLVIAASQVGVRYAMKEIPSSANSGSNSLRSIERLRSLG